MDEAADKIDADELGQLYLGLHHRVHRLIDEAMVAAGLSLSRAKVLRELAEHGPMNQSALAARLDLAARSVTEMVDVLERDALAVRTVDPGDRRAKLVEITPAGATALATAMAAKRQAMEQIFGTLDAPARAECAAMLTSMRDRLTTTSGEQA